MSSRRGPRHGGARGRGSSTNYDSSDANASSSARYTIRGRGNGVYTPPNARFNNDNDGGRGRGRGRGPSESRGRGSPVVRVGGISNTQGSADATFRDLSESTLITYALQQVTTEGDAQSRFETLKKRRPEEKRKAIEQGLMNPDHAIAIQDRVPIRGTCEDMCPEYERVRRQAQDDMQPPEFFPETLHGPRRDRKPDEARMVKAFARSAAGNEAQLPSDIRTPQACMKALAFMFKRVDSEGMRFMNKYIWDRTRAIRNDLYMQDGITKPQDVKTRLDCFEQCARWHIVSLHTMAAMDDTNYSHQQDLEQLRATLVTLKEYYGQHRVAKTVCANEAEFRSYMLISGAMSEVELQSLPSHIQVHPRIQTALKIGRTANEALAARGQTFAVARKNWQAFWSLIKSYAVSYHLAAVSETFFLPVRDMVLTSLFKACRRAGGTQSEDWTIPHLIDILGFDTADEAIQFCEAYGFSFGTDASGDHFLDLASVQAVNVSSSMKTQVFSNKFVESKRHGRSFRALVEGMSVLEAQKSGMLVVAELTGVPQEEDSLFVPDLSVTRTTTSPFNAAKPTAPTTVASSTTPSTLNPFATSFQPRSGADPPQPGTFHTLSGPSGGLFHSSPGIPGQTSSFGKPSSFNPFPSANPTPTAALSSSSPSPNAGGSSLNGAGTQSPSLPNSFTTNPTTGVVVQPGIFDSTKNSIKFADQRPGAINAGSSFTNPLPSTASTSGSSFSPSSFVPPAISPFRRDGASPTPVTSTQNGMQQPATLSSWGMPSSTAGFPNHTQSSPTSLSTIQNGQGTGFPPSSTATPQWQFSSAPQATSQPSFSNQHPLPTGLPNTGQILPSQITTSTTTHINMGEEQRRRAQEEQKRKAEEEQKHKAEEEVKRKAQEEFKRVQEERRRKAEEEQQRQARKEQLRQAQEEEKRKAREEERRRHRIQEEKDESMNALARQLFIDSEPSLLEQFIENEVQVTFWKVTDELRREEVDLKAGSFRKANLARRALEAWVKKAYKMRLKKHGRNRRQRLKALQAEQLAKEDIVSANVQPPHEPSHETYTNTPVVVVDSLTKTRATASQTADKQTQSALVSQRSFRKPATSASTPRPRARTKCKQRSESLSQNTPSLNNSTTSLNSSQSSLSTTLNPLDTSVAFDQTETDWFRLRALGIDPSRVRKRSFDSDEEEEKRNPDGDRLRGRSSNTPAARIALPPPTTTIDPLARWEAYKARSRTAASSPIEKIPTPVVQHGFNESFAPNPSPAPAYRNRVSRFVPRHLYGKGRDAVREYRASIRNSQGSQGSPSQTGAGLGPLDLSSPIQTHQSYSTNYANFSGNDGDQDPEYDDEQYVQGDEEYEYEEDDYYDEDDEGVGTNMAGGTQDDAIELSD